MTSPTVASVAESKLAPRALQLSQTFAYYTAFVVLGMSAAVLGPTLSALADHTGSTLSQASILFTTRALGYMLGSLFSGRLYDRSRLKGHSLMAMAFVFTAVMLSITPLVSQLWPLAAAMFMLSLADSAVDVGGNTLLVWVHGRKVGPYMNALHFFFGVGASIAPIFVAQALAWSGGVDWAYWSIAILALLPAIWLLRLPSPSHPVTTHEISHAKFDTRLVVLIAVCFFLFVALEAGFAGWIFSYALAVGFGSETTAAVLNSVFWAAFTLARLASIPMATRFSPRTIVIADLVISAMGATVMLIGGQTAPAAVWIGAICLGVGSAALFPTMISFAETRMRITGQVTSIFLAGASLAGMTIPWLIGQLFVSVGPQALPWAMLICALAGLAVFAVANRASAQPSAS